MTESTFDINAYSVEVRKHYQSVSVAVFIPLLQAVLTGILAALVTFGTFLMLHILYPVISTTFAFGASLLALGVVSLYTWQHLMSHWKLNIARLEERLRQDIDLDGKINDQVIPQQGDYVMRVFLASEDNPGSSEVTKFENMTPDRFLDILDLILNSNKFTEELLLSSFNNRDEFIRFRDEFLRIGVLVWKNADHRDRGVLITKRGFHVLEAMYKSPPPLLVSYTH